MDDRMDRGAGASAGEAGAVAVDGFFSGDVSADSVTRRFPSTLRTWASCAIS